MSDIIAHLRNSHCKTTGLKQYNCPWCNKTFEATIYISKHKKGRVASALRCEDCGRVIARERSEVRE